jgi:hypothetical protein
VIFGRKGWIVHKVAETFGTIVTSFAQADASDSRAADANKRRKAVFRASRGKGNLFQYLNISDWRYRSTIIIFHLGVDAGGVTTLAENERTRNLSILFAPHESCKVGWKVEASIERHSRILSGVLPRARKNNRNSATISGVKNSGF